MLDSADLARVAEEYWDATVMRLHQLESLRHVDVFAASEASSSSSSGHEPPRHERDVRASVALLASTESAVLVSVFPSELRQYPRHLYSHEGGKSVRRSLVSSASTFASAGVSNPEGGSQSSASGALLTAPMLRSIVLSAVARSLSVWDREHEAALPGRASVAWPSTRSSFSNNSSSGTGLTAAGVLFTGLEEDLSAFKMRKRVRPAAAEDAVNA